MKLQSDVTIKFLTKKRVEGKNGVYYLYTFLDTVNDDTFTLYCKNNYELDCMADVKLVLAMQVFNNKANFVLEDILEV